MRPQDPIEIVEAAYALELSHLDWQRRLTELIAERWGGGVLSFVYDASDAESLVRTHAMAVGLDADVARLHRDEVFTDPEHVRAVFQSGPHLISLDEALGPGYAEQEHHRRFLEQNPELRPYTVGLRTLDPSHRGLCFALTRRPITPRRRRAWNRVACHIAIAFRLRRTLDRRDDGGGAPIGDAVLDGDGRCLHAEGEARSAEAQAVLKEAARRVMRARSSLRHRDADEALEIWRGLVAGRWSLVDRFETGEGHYLIAHDNPPQAADRRALVAPASQVASYLGMQFSPQLIGYSLGLTSLAAAQQVASIAARA